MDRGGRGGVSEEPAFGARRYIRSLSNAAKDARRAVAFDSSALIMFLERRARYAPLLLPLLIKGGPGVLISTVSLAEALVVPARSHDPVEIDRARAEIMDIPGLIVISLDEECAVQIAVIRARTGLKFPDSAIIAAAHVGDACALIGNDRIWKNRDLGVPYHHLDDILGLDEQISR